MPTGTFFCASNVPDRRVFPAGRWSNCTPHSLEPVHFYIYFCRLVLLVFNLMPNVDWTSVTVKRLYVFLDQRPARLPGISVCDLNEVFRNIHHSNLDHRLRDLNWRIIWGAVKTAHRVFKWGIGNGRCPRANCGKRESISHVFWGCSFPSLLWVWVEHVGGKLKRKPLSLTELCSLRFGSGHLSRFRVNFISARRGEVACVVFAVRNLIRQVTNHRRSDSLPYQRCPKATY